jgi:fatty-acyl-CoA synthase
MAESTLAVSFAELDKPVEIDTIDRLTFKHYGRAVPVEGRASKNQDRARSFVVCGKPLPGHKVMIVDEMGRALAERKVGRILIKGPSLMGGYFGNEAATEAVMHAGGYMDTGDMGYLTKGSIVVTGRAKELILHNGRNIWPQDVEWAAERVEPLRSGDVAAFAVEGPQGEDQVVVLVECRLTQRSEMEKLRHGAQAAVLRACGITCEVVLVAPRSLPFTSSGKLSRMQAKTLFLAGQIGEIGRGKRMAGQLRVAAGH